MSLIIVSAEDFSLGEEICLRAAKTLNYRYVGRELLDEVAKEHQAAREDLLRTLDELPGFMTRRSQRRRLLSFIEAACLDRLLEDGAVCHGLAAHLYVRGVPHALKVRIINDSEQWAQAVSGEKGISLERARRRVKHDREAQRRWSQDAYCLDQTDASLYDMVLSLGSLEKEKVTEIICDTAGYRKFHPMTYSRKLMQDIVLASSVRLKLMDQFPDIRVESNEGTVVAYIQSLKKDQRQKQEIVRKVAGGIEGVRHVEVHVIRDYVGRAAQSCR